MSLGWAGVGLLVAAGAWVFWGFDALPFQDLPAHAGLIALRHRFAVSPFDQRFFVFAPRLGPYSLFRFLGNRLLAPLGPSGTVRALATLPLVATPLALVFARRRLHADRSPSAAYFGITLTFGFMTLLGFASYLLGVAALIVGLTLWLELLAAGDRSDAWKREVRVALIAPLLFVAHGDAFAIFVLLAGATTFFPLLRPSFPSGAGDRDPWKRTRCLRALAPGCALAAVSALGERAGTVPSGSAPLPRHDMHAHFQGVLDKLSLLVTPTLMTRWGVDVLVGLFIWIVVASALVATVRHGRRAGGATASFLGVDAPATELEARDGRDPRDDSIDVESQAHTRALVGAVIALAAAFAVLPHSIGWFGFVDGRLVPLLVIVALMAVRRPALSPTLRKVFDRGAAGSAVVMIAVALAASQRFQAEAAGWHEVLAAVPANARLLNLPLDPDSDVFTAHPFVHYDKWVLAARPAVVSDIWFHQGTAIFPTAVNPALRLPSTYSESDLRGVDWPEYRLDDWSYVLVRTRPGAGAPSVPRALTLVEHRGGWWLYRNGGAAS